MAPDPRRRALTRALVLARALTVALAVACASDPAAAPAPPAEVVVDGVVHVRNGGEALEGVKTLRLEEQWRAGGEASEILFGSVGRIVADAAGNVYVLDRQMSQVQVFGPDGRHLRTLSREGDGPGEVRRPSDLLLLPDGRIGIVQMMPGRIVTLRPDGTPAGNIEPGAAEDTGERGNMFTLFGARPAGDGLLIGGGRMAPRPDRIVRPRHIARVGLDGREIRRYREGVVESDPADLKFDEALDWFPHNGGMVAAPDGRVWLATARDEYAIEAWSPDGKLERVIERTYEPYRRSAEEKRIADDTRRMVINGNRMPNIIADTEPAIVGMSLMPGDELWVLTSRGRNAPPPGALQLWDVFDARGRFVRQVAIAAEGRPREDAVALLEDGRAVVVRGALDAARGSMRGVGVASAAGSSGGGAADAQTGADEIELELICGRLRP